MRLRVASVLSATAIALSLVAPGAVTAQEAPADSHSSAMVTSPADGAKIDIEIYRPGTASAANPVPILLQGPGWGGSKTSSNGAFGPYLKAGYGVVSITPRGFGNSGGEVTVMDPELEGQDYIAVLDHIQTLDWVATEEREVTTLDGTTMTIEDPLLGAIGGSYGGGYQFLVALNELRTRGYTRMDALSPQITWHNLNTALAPADVPRTAWLTLLYAVGSSSVAPYVTEGYLYGAATGNYPDGSVPLVVDLKSEFASHGPSFHVGQDIQLDIPVMMRQGFSDNLFNFNEAWDNWTVTLTDEARAGSTLVGYNGGHALPNVYPVGSASGSDACVSNYTTTEIAFFDAVFSGQDTRVLGDPLLYTTVDGDCLRLQESDVVEEDHALATLDPSGTLGSATGTVSTAGAPLSIEIADTAGITIGGVPTISGNVYAVGADARAFLALSVGTSPTNAVVIQNNVMPIRATGGATLGTPFSMELPGVAAELEPGEKLFLTISGTSDMFFGHGSRTPGAIGMTDVTVTLPVVQES